MPIDWDLLRRVELEGYRRQQAYQCSFVEAIRMPGRHPHELVTIALGILAVPYDCAGAEGARVRGHAEAKDGSEELICKLTSCSVSGEFEGR